MANKVEIVVQITDRASSALGGITNSLSGMAAVAGGIISADLIGRISEKMTGVVMSGFDMASQIENLTLRLDAFTKNGEKTAEMLAWARDEAAKTPFAFADIGDAIAQVLPVANQLDVDYQELIRTAEVLSALNPMEGLAGGVFSLKEALQGDFVSIAERFGLDKHRLRELRDEGIPALQAVQQVLSEMGADMDLVANQSTSTSARLDRFKETIVNLATAAATPLFDWFSEQLGSFLGDLDANMPSLEEKATWLGNIIADIPKTIQQAWAGDWVDSSVIMPIHRITGTLTQNLKGAWDTVQGLWQRSYDFWQTGWIQNTIIEPVSKLSALIRNDLITDFSNLDREWQDLNRAGEVWNELMAAGQQLWNTLVGYAGVLGINLGTVGTNLGNTNVEMAKSRSLGEMLSQIFTSITYAINAMSLGILTATQRLQAFINLIQWAITQAQNLGAAMQGQVYSNGIPVGPAATPPPAPNYIPNSDDHSMISGRAMAGVGVGAGVPVIMNVYNQLDYEEAAYRIARIMQDRR